MFPRHSLWKRGRPGAIDVTIIPWRCRSGGRCKPVTRAGSRPFQELEKRILFYLWPFLQNRIQIISILFALKCYLGEVFTYYTHTHTHSQASWDRSVNTSSFDRCDPSDSWDPQTHRCRGEGRLPGSGGGVRACACVTLSLIHM